MNKLKSLVIIILLMSSLTFIYYIPRIDSYIFAFKNDIRISEIRYGPYYKIIEGKNTKEDLVFIFKIYRTKGNYIISQNEGITRDEAQKISIKNGYTSETNQIELWISHRKTGKIDCYEAIKKNLVWRIYYDVPNSYFVEVDFETGELFDFSTLIKNRSNNWKNNH